MAAKKKKPENPNPGWTCEDINQSALVIFVLATFIFWALSFAFVAYYHNKYHSEELAVASNVPAIGKMIESYNGVDRLQPDPPAEIAAMDKQQAKKLGSYGWVNQAAGKVRIPIDEAINRKLGTGFLKAKDVVDPYEGKLVVRPVKFQMKFDKPSYTAKAGEDIHMVFINDDVQPHNLLIAEPGSKEEIGGLGDKAMVEAAEKYVAAGYMPDSPKIMHKLGLVNPNQTGDLKFKAPEKAGDYVVICTFPGHWRTMNSILKVVE